MEHNRLLEIASDRETCDFCLNCGNDNVCVKCEKVKGIKAGDLREYHTAVKAALRRTAEDDKAREEGRLVELPQDGMLYHIEEVTETGEKWVGNKPIQKITFTCGHGLVGIPFDFSQIGKTVFLTRQAAEAALGGGEGE